MVSLSRPARLLDAVERVLSAAFEHDVLRLFRARLEPVHVVRAIERTMRERALVTPGGMVVPSAFTVRVSPDDAQRLQEATPSIASDLALQLQDLARLRSWRLLVPPVVELVADSGIKRGRAVVLVDQRASSASHAVDPADPPTSRLARVREGLPRVIIERPDGAVLAFQQAVIRLGRGAENQVVLAHPEVSRHHAEVRVSLDGATVHDLESTNGTWLDDKRVTAAPLSSRARLRLGGAELHLQVLQP